MPNTNASNLDYPALILSLIKQNALSFILGAFILLILGFYALSYSGPKLRPVLSRVFSDPNKDDKKPTPTKKVRTYTVQPGDQLFLIAEKIYGSGLNMQNIMDTNKIKNPDSIEVGQVLIIPEVTPKFPTTGSITDNAASTSRVNEKSEKYVVKQGDDLAKIALETYGDSYAWVRIAEANNLLNPDDLRVGMILIIPR